MTHVLDKFKFCPVCGSQHFEINNFKSKKCKDCGFTYYLNPSSATVAFILNEKEELLVVRRKNEPAKGTLDLPGGFVDMDETGEENYKNETIEGSSAQIYLKDDVVPHVDAYRPIFINQTVNFIFGSPIFYSDKYNIYVITFVILLKN